MADSCSKKQHQEDRVDWHIWDDGWYLPKSLVYRWVRRSMLAFFGLLLIPVSFPLSKFEPKNLTDAIALINYITMSCS